MEKGLKPRLIYDVEKNMVFGLGLVGLQLLEREKEISKWNKKKFEPKLKLKLQKINEPLLKGILEGMLNFDESKRLSLD